MQKKKVKILKILIIACVYIHTIALKHILFQIKTLRKIDQICNYFAESEETGTLGCSRKIADYGFFFPNSNIYCIKREVVED